MDKIEEELERKQQVHAARTSLRSVASGYGGLLVPGLLLAMLVYANFVGITNRPAGDSLSQIGLLFRLSIPAALAVVMLAKRSWLEEKLSGIIATPFMQKVLDVNTASSTTAGLVIAVSTVLYFLGLGFFVTLGFWFSLGAYLLLLSPGFNAWLNEEPDLTLPKSPEEIRAEEEQFQRARKRVAPFSAAAPKPAPAEVEQKFDLDDVDEVLSKEPDQPAEDSAELVKARADLEAAQKAVQDAENAELFGSGEKLTVRQMGGLRGRVTRLQGVVDKLEAENATS